MIIRYYSPCNTNVSKSTIASEQLVIKNCQQKHFEDKPMLHKLHGNCNEVTQAAAATWQTLMKLHGNFNEKKSMY